MPIIVPDPSDAATFLLSGRPTPQKTSDWMRLLVIVLSYVALKDPFEQSMFYAADTPAYRETETDEGNEVYNGVTAVFHPLAPVFSLVSTSRPVTTPATASAFLVLHPAGAHMHPDLEEPDSLPVAGGALLLPGVPELGLDHRAAWAAVSVDGEIANMNYTSHAKLTEHQDIAVLSALLGNS